MKRNGSRPSLRNRLSGDVLEAFAEEFSSHRAEVVQALRKQNVVKFAETLVRLVQASEPLPDPKDLNSSDSTRDISRKVLQSVGLSEPDDDSIAEAIKANDVYVSTLEDIVSRAQGRCA
jgi:hypothetical protein